MSFKNIILILFDISCLLDDKKKTTENKKVTKIPELNYVKGRRTKMYLGCELFHSEYILSLSIIYHE